MRVVIGTWVEKASRDINHCPSYYAADHETLRTRPGRYDLVVTFEGGYTIPMPYWLLTTVDADRVAGRLYSGAAGVNFASRELPLEPAPFHLQTYVSGLQELVAEGTVEIKPEFAGLVADHKAQLEWASQHTWESLRALGGQ